MPQSDLRIPMFWNSSWELSVDCSLSITDDFAACYSANSRCFLIKVNVEFGVFSSLLSFNFLTVYIFACTEPCSSIENYLYKTPWFPSVVSRINFPSCGFVPSHEQPSRTWVQPCISSNPAWFCLSSASKFSRSGLQAFPSIMN